MTRTFKQQDSGRYVTHDLNWIIRRRHSDGLDKDYWVAKHRPSGKERAFNSLKEAKDYVRAEMAA